MPRRIDAQGNTTCYAHDALHRTTSITYSGPYAANTPTKYFVYDSATVNSVGMANAKTRLAEAYTCVSSCTTKLTDTGFSYSPRGEINDLYESTPNSGGYYHVNALYWESGALKQLSGLPSLPTISYTPDAQGRLNTVTASSGQNPVTGTVYSPYAAPQLTVNFGSSDSDVFTADTSTGRLTQYRFKIGATQSLTGNLTWNANGSLQQQAITDNFNSANTQTCNYAYDDISRLASGNCGSAASQTFSYDPFGNINKSGSPFSFQPTYSNATNRMTNIAGFTPSYDNNGNVLNDGAHQYAPDAENRPVTTDSVTLTYDALGRMVEQNRSSVYTQIVYGPGGGKLALMSGQTLTKAFVALPGGAQAVYNSGGLLYYAHSDHLGSARLGSTTTRTVSWDLAYAPFGEPYAQSGTPDLSFTGQRQDTSSVSAGLYDFLAREYSTQGRWPSPDPAGLSVVSLSNPQSWNRYDYVGNNPLSRIDPKGLHYYDCTWFGDCLGMQGGGGGGYYGGGPGGCSLDGVQTACGNLTGLGSNGIQACPGPCTTFNNVGQIIQFHAFAGLAEAVNGYYAVSGVGSLSYTVVQAGIAAAQWGIWYESQTGSEVGGSLWCAYGVCSSTLQQPGQPGAGFVVLDFGFSDIPNGTDPAGWWRAQSGESPSRDLNAIDSVNAQFGTSFSLFTGDFGDPGGPVLLYNKGINSGYECVLVGPVPPSGIDGPCPR